MQSREDQLTTFLREHEVIQAQTCTIVHFRAVCCARRRAHARRSRLSVATRRSWSPLVPPATGNGERGVDVAVVGAGVTGLSVAWHLRKNGAEVLVLERRGVAAGASGVQPGGVRQQGSPAVNCRLARESAGFYRRAGDLLGGPVELRFTPRGYMFLAHSPPALDRLRANVAVQAAAGVPSRVVDPVEAARLVPGLATATVLGATWC